MEAGYGAELQASRRARRAAQRRREIDAAEAVTAAVDQNLEHIQKQQRAWAQGAEGERQVADALTPLEQYGWTALHDVRWPGRRRANIDHIAIGPGGVVIIDAKNWTGKVTISGGTLRQNGYSREREVDGVDAAAAAVAALVAPEERASVHAVICLAGQDQEPTPVGPRVIAMGRHQLAAWLVGRPSQLTPYAVAGIGQHLHRLLDVPRSDTKPAKKARSRPSPRGRRQSGRLGHALLALALLVVFMSLTFSFAARLAP